METKPTNTDKNVAAVTHLSTFSKYFIPFGNFIFPLLLWTVHKDTPFVNEHGRQALNFQLSILVYTLWLRRWMTQFWRLNSLMTMVIYTSLRSMVHPLRKERLMRTGLRKKPTRMKPTGVMSKLCLQPFMMIPELQTPKPGAQIWRPFLTRTFF